MAKSFSRVSGIVRLFIVAEMLGVVGTACRLTKKYDGTIGYRSTGSSFVISKVEV